MVVSNALLAIRILAVDAVASLLYFPVWWYTAGAWRMARHAAGVVGGFARSFGVRVWLKNLFRPMYGQYDFASRIISFFIRLVMIIFYSAVLAILSAIMAALFLLWLAIPAVIVYGLGIQIVGLIKDAKP
ncbi:MAG: hypothetical protein WCT10_00510 [Patescibacteria group bacterium]|jgi:hypothetical protein